MTCRRIPYPAHSVDRDLSSALRNLLCVPGREPDNAFRLHVRQASVGSPERRGGAPTGIMPLAGFRLEEIRLLVTGNYIGQSHLATRLSESMACSRPHDSSEIAHAGQPPPFRDLPLGESSRSEAFNLLRPIHPHREDRRDRSGGVALKSTVRRGLVALNIASTASYGNILRSRGPKSSPSGVQGFRPQWVRELTPEVAIPIPSILMQQSLPLTPQEHS